MDRRTEPEYRRYVAVLREDKRNYAITPTRRPRGKATIELRGARGLLNCSVKNLTPPKTGISQSYVVWLVTEEAGRSFPVQAGTIEISKEGLGESSWNFDVDSVKKAGLDIEGFITLEVRVNTMNRKVPGDRVLVGQLELEEVNLPEEPKMEKVSPFGGAMPSHQWWKFYPGYLHERMSNSPVPLMSRECLGKPGEHQTGPVFQGHQLVGLQNDENGAVKLLVHGIPGRFCLRDQPYGGTTGYAYWHPLPGQQYKAGQYGYWLVYLNPITGEVVFPKKATVPPDCDRCDIKDRE